MAIKIEQAKKYAKIEAPNGYKFDVSNFLYNPSFGNEYPAFYKAIQEDGDRVKYRRVYYFKHYDKTASICVETFYRVKNGDQWQIVNRNGAYTEETVECIPDGVRFNPKMLFKYCV